MKTLLVLLLALSFGAGSALASACKDCGCTKKCSTTCECPQKKK